ENTVNPLIKKHSLPYHDGARLEKSPKAQRTPASIAQFTYIEASGLFNTRDLTLATQRLILIVCCPCQTLVLTFVCTLI
ncbi:hypothetical protein AB4520_18715, partial [Vibrio renipiscarius]|uniref:hypothetical protein n=1 Tax=Vibrio renipiscarius TaxID=1461322 RepID=UPI003552A06C